MARRRRLGSSARPARDARLLAVDEDRSAGARARLDAIQKQEQDALFVEDPGERGSVDMFSGLNLTPEVLTYWESQHAFFFPRLLLFSMTALGLAASVPQSLGGVFRGDADALSVLATNVLFLVVAAAVTVADLSGRKKELGRLQRELALGDMRVIQRDKFRNERVFPLASLRQAARVAIVYGDAEKVAKDLAAATPFRRRLEQSRILVVPVVERSGMTKTSGNPDGVADVGPGRWELLKDVVQAWPGAGAGRWLAWPTQNDAWAGYFRRLLESAGVDDPAARQKLGGYVTLGVTGQVRGSGAGSPSWDVLLSTFPRNRPGNAQDAAAEAAWREATVDSGAVGALGAVDTEEDPAAAEKLRDIRANGAARPIGTVLSLPDTGAAAAVLRAHDAFYDALARGDEDAMRAAWRPGGGAGGVERRRAGQRRRVPGGQGRAPGRVGDGAPPRPAAGGFEALRRGRHRRARRRDGDRARDGGQRRDAARHADLREGHDKNKRRGRRGLDPAVALHDPVREGHGGEDRAAVRRARVRSGSGQSGGERQDGVTLC